MTIAALVFAVSAVGYGLVAQQPPGRDAGVQPTIGTASVSGVVVTDEDEPRPVRRAIVTLSGDGLRPNRGAITDDAGRFTIERLPAGRFTLTVTRAAFITSVYGAKRPGRPGTPVVLDDGEDVGDLVVRLWRGAAIAGTLRDETGAPVESITVSAVPARESTEQGIFTLSNNGTTTNDRGEYRIFGLAPGKYVVAAQPSSGSAQPMIALAEAQIDAAFAALRRRGTPGDYEASRPDAPIESEPYELARVYFPGTPVMSNATILELVPGQEVLGVDFPLQRVRTSVVAGTLVRPDGQPAAGASVQLTALRGSDLFASEPALVINTTSNPDGTFRFAQVQPGDYELVARAPVAPRPAATGGVVSPGIQGDTFWAKADLSIGGTDVAGLILDLRPGLTLSGRVVFEADSLTPPENLAQIQIGLFSPEILNARPGTSIRSIAFTRPATVRPDGTFELSNIVPGTYRFRAAGRPIGDSGWWARSAMLDGRDLLDGRVEIGPDMSLTGVVVTFTDRRTELSGTLQTAEGAPAADVFVIAFARDRSFWGPDARRVQAVRPGVDGRFVFSGLPPGEYRLAAVTDVDGNDWEDPAFLERLLAASVPATLGEAEKKVQDLRIGGTGR